MTLREHQLISDNHDSPFFIIPFLRTPNDISIPNQEDHGFYMWVNGSSGTGCSPLAGVSWEPWALPIGLHYVVLTVWANVRISTLFAPPASNILAHSLTVAPVV